MRRVFAALMVIGLSLMAISQAGATGDHKVTICHRTNSNTNPYVQITVDVHAVDGQGNHDHYGRHQGPVWNPTLKAQHIKWGDIIPPVPGIHDGLNWTTEGLAFYNANCSIPAPPSTTTTTVVETTTTTMPETTTTTVPETTTTTVVEETTTTVPETTTTVGETTTTLDEETSSTQVIAVPTGELDELPRTGGVQWALLVLGVSLIVIGAIALRSGRQLL